MKPMYVIQDPEQDTTVVVLAAADYSSIRHAQQDRLCDELLRLADRMTTARVILDLSSVRCYGAAFLGRLVWLSRRLASRGQQLCVCGDPQDLLGLMRLDRLFPVFPTLNEALGEGEPRCKTGAVSWRMPDTDARRH